MSREERVELNKLDSDASDVDSASIDASINDNDDYDDRRVETTHLGGAATAAATTHRGDVSEEESVQQPLLSETINSPESADQPLTTRRSVKHVRYTDDVAAGDTAELDDLLNSRGGPNTSRGGDHTDEEAAAETNFGGGENGEVAPTRPPFNRAFEKVALVISWGALIFVMSIIFISFASACIFRLEYDKVS